MYSNNRWLWNMAIKGKPYSTQLSIVCGDCDNLITVYKNFPFASSDPQFLLSSSISSPASPPFSLLVLFNSFSFLICSLLKSWCSMPNLLPTASYSYDTLAGYIACWEGVIHVWCSLYFVCTANFVAPLPAELMYSYTYCPCYLIQYYAGLRLVGNQVHN